MTVKIKAPAFPESVADGVVSAWHKAPGDSVARDELLVEIETDKVVMEVVAPEPGVIEAIMVAEGETITSEAVLADPLHSPVLDDPDPLSEEEEDDLMAFLKALRGDRVLSLGRPPSLP